MVSIFVAGQDKTGQISDWEIRCRQDELVLTCVFPSQKRFSRLLSECKVDPTRELDDTLLRRSGSSSVSAVEKAIIYGERYAVVTYRGSPKHYVFNLKDIEFLAPTNLEAEPPFQYFRTVAQARVNEAASEEQRIIAENIVRQLDAVPACAETALHAYCSGRNGQQVSSGGFIFPFGLNESQLQAVEQAFASQVSVIEGPPGTGKTQTILNIVANVLLQGKTVAIVSNNNAAVTNVYEKLAKSGLDYLVAKLGSKENREAFFAQLPARPPMEPERQPQPSMEDIQAVLLQLKHNLSARNAVARLQNEIDELEIERRYLLQWQADNAVGVPVRLDKYKLSPQKTTDLLAYLTRLAGKRIGFRNRVELLLGFRIFRIGPFDEPARRQSLVNSLQLHFYDKALLERKAELAAHHEALRTGNFETLLDELTSSSMRYLKAHLSRHVPTDQSFELKTYRRNFDSFVQRYPVIGSSTHSLVNSLGRGAILDYLIIDEASQQDIVPGVLGLGCARNLVVVGDRKQLAHIPTPSGVPVPGPDYDCEKYSLLDSCVGIFKGSIPITLLKEHYRCHPRIIQFCNQQFYDNQLVPMTHDKGESALTLLVTAKGNHARGNTNLRELDSLLAILEGQGESVWSGEDGRGFIAPFRAQATLSGTQLPADFINDTVHKFQGRECDEIVFSTVLDKRNGVTQLDFVDDARMVNVAVSRARHRFTLVTGDEVFTTSNGHIAALVRYIQYYAEEKQIHRAPVVSAFDLLYQEYDQSLERLNSRLRAEDSEYKSERIVAQLLRETLAQDAHRALTFHTQIALNKLVSISNEAFTARELEFIGNQASCDFVVYFRVGKQPLGVIEVDGGSHEEQVQAERDALKNSILHKCGIALLRLKTVESRIEEKLATFVSQWAAGVTDKTDYVPAGSNNQSG